MLAAVDAREARAAFLRSEANVSGGAVVLARDDLTTAVTSLPRMKVTLDRLGPILGVSRRLSVDGTQVAAVETLRHPAWPRWPRADRRCDRGARQADGGRRDVGRS